MRQDSTVQTQWSDEKLRAQPHLTVRARGRRASDVWPMLLRARAYNLAPTPRPGPAAPRRHGPAAPGAARRQAAARQAAVGRHKGSRTPTRARTNPAGSSRGRGHERAVAYRGANGPLLLTKQAQHSTDQYYPQCSHCLMISVVYWGNRTGQDNIFRFHLIIAHGF